MIEYVKAKRKKPIREFHKVNCWFVNNSNAVNRAILTSPREGKQPNIIRASDLLNILWLSNPGVQESVNSTDIAENGLTSMISLAVMPELPRKKTIRDLEANIRKYAGEELTDTDIVRLANRITANGINDLEGLNSIARTSSVEFVQRLKEESSKQEKVEADQSDRLEKAIAQLTNKYAKADQLLDSYEKAKGEISVVTEQMASRLKDTQQRLTASQEELRVERLKPEVKRYKTSKLRRRRAGAIGVAFLFIAIFFIFNKYVDLANIDVLTGVDKSGVFLIWGAGVFGVCFCVKPIYNLCFDDNYISKFKSEIELPDRLK